MKHQTNTATDTMLSKESRSTVGVPSSTSTGSSSTTCTSSTTLKDVHSLSSSSTSYDVTSNTDATSSTTNILSILPTPIHGKSDWRSYRCLQLTNGVTVCLVHDKESKTTAAAATVTTGAASDPRNMSGLAHFCEHMCFLGSVRYPGENEYKRYLAQHGGRSNASTSLHTTTYKFEVLAPHAEHVLDIFSHFFIAPLFTSSGTGREINAVDSENSKNLTADIRRRLQIMKHIGDQDHYFTKFTTGNAKTLPTSTDEELSLIREALLAFHAKHYRPEKLTVVIAGPQSLDTLQEWAVPRFAAMKADDYIFPTDVQQMTDVQKMIHEAAQHAPPYDCTAPELPFTSPFRPDLQSYLTDDIEAGSSSSSQRQIDAVTDHRTTNVWPILVSSNPVRSMRKLAMLFPMPPVYKEPDRSPTAVLSHLLGHEGPNSPFAVLQNLGLLSSLSAGSRFSGPDFTVFQVEIGLTEQGEEQWKMVVDIVLQHCRLIASTAKQAVVEQQQKQSAAAATDGITNDGSNSIYQYLQQLWAETGKLNSMAFDFASPGGVYDLVPDLATSIVQHGTETALSAGRMLQENESTFPLEKVVDFASRLVPSNMIIERCSKRSWEEMEQRMLDHQQETTTNGQQPSSLIVVEPDGAVIERKTEPWYGIDYFLSRISPHDANRWEGKDPFLDASELIRLPIPNRYIPRALELCPDLPDEAKQGPRIEKEMEPPNLIINDDSTGRLWHRLDDRYALPKSALNFLLRNPATEHVQKASADGSLIWQYDTKAAVHSSFLSAMFTEALAQETYDATLAGLHWNLTAVTTGIRMNSHGFSDRLPDLSLKVLGEFMNGDFIKESFFLSAKDRMIRNLQTFFESRRADAHAQYYRDFLLSASDIGIEDTLRTVQLATLESVKAHHTMLIKHADTCIDCLFAGNVSEEEAKTFFKNAAKLIANANPAITIPKNLDSFRPGTLERKLIPGKDIELHFASKNTQEENGACLVTLQSSVPGYRGELLSTPESLHSSACIRLLCHMLREPLFNELRTKQTLGYIVSSYHDINFSCLPSPDSGLQQSVPVDVVVIYVLSKKVSPQEITSRIDEFLIDFRKSLENMPDSEIKHHAIALSTKIVKPIQKLGTETSAQFSKIRRYASEVLGSKDVVNNKVADMPWNSAKTLAVAIESLTRDDIIETWDRLTDPASRSRIVSCVYGTTFPLKPESVPKGTSSKTLIVDSLNDVLQLRNKLSLYNNVAVTSSHFHKSSLTRSFALPSFLLKSTSQYRSSSVLGIAAVLGVGMIAAGWTIMGRNKKSNR